MNDVRRIRRRPWFVLSTALLGAACNSETPPPPMKASSRPQSAAAASGAKPRPKPAASIAPVALKEEPPPRGVAGEWIDAKMYRIRVGRVIRCDDPSAKRAGSSIRLGVELEIAARADNVFVASRDVGLAREGVLVDSVHATEAPKACQPLFQPTTLREGKSTSGVVLFDAPDVEFARTAVLTFRPTRWGGAPLTEVKLPACLDACTDGKK
jgi:hypothetical protein